MNIIVFSKNRPLQLDLFIRSFNKYVKNSKNYKINILYTTNNIKFEKGYNMVNDRFNNIVMYKEKNFKDDILSLIDKSIVETVFFVDDDIFKDHIDFNDKQKEIFKNNQNILCRSLRLSKHLEKCYSLNMVYTKIPLFQSIENYILYKWIGQQGDYGYPMSLDGHIFRTNDILPLIIQYDFKNPNSMESILSMNPIRKSYIICYEKSKILNNPCNIVQTYNSNIHGNEDINILNNEYLNGNQISMVNIDSINNISCHQEIKIIFEKKN